MNIPECFKDYTTLPRNNLFITVDGARIHYQQWNKNIDKQGLLFVHGYGAHCHWWDFIEPAFIDDYTVATGLRG